MGNLTGKEVAQMHKDYVMQSWQDQEQILYR